MKDADVPVQALDALEGMRFPELALSVYLPTGPGVGRDSYRALLDDLARAALPMLDEAERTVFERELPAVLAGLQKRRFDCPAVAVFSCRPRGLLRIWRLTDAVRRCITVAGTLDLAPIRRQLEAHPPALAAVVDKRHARLYALVLEELVEVGQLDGAPIRRHRQGGWSAAALQRREDEHARSHLDEVAGAVTRLLDRNGYRRLILAGPSEARAVLKGLLPASASKLVTAEGTFPVYAAGNELAVRLHGLDHRPAPA